MRVYRSVKKRERQQGLHSFVMFIFQLKKRKTIMCNQDAISGVLVEPCGDQLMPSFMSVYRSLKKEKDNKVRPRRHLLRRGRTLLSSVVAFFCGFSVI